MTCLPRSTKRADIGLKRRKKPKIVSTVSVLNLDGDVAITVEANNVEMMQGVYGKATCKAISRRVKKDGGSRVGTWALWRRQLLSYKARQGQK